MRQIIIICALLIWSCSAKMVEVKEHNICSETASVYELLDSGVLNQQGRTVGVEIPGNSKVIVDAHAAYPWYPKQTIYIQSSIESTSHEVTHARVHDGINTTFEMWNHGSQKACARIVWYGVQHPAR